MYDHYVHFDLFVIFVMMNTAPNASRMLNGMANGSIPNGSTFILPVTSHISTKPTNQDKSVV